MNNQYLDPISVTEQPRQDFIRHLMTAYPLADPHLRYGLKKQLEQSQTVWQHPYIEGSQPYRPANSVRDLVDLNILHPEMESLLEIACDRSSKINIRVLENLEISASIRKEELELALDNLKNIGINCHVKVQLKHNKRDFYNT